MIEQPLVQDTHVVIFIYGENGAGKTHLAATAPGKVAFIDYDANISVLLKFPDKERFTIFTGPKTWNEMKKMCIDPVLDPFDTIVLDNFTGMYRYILTDVVKTIPTKGADSRPSPETPILRDYGLGSERLRYLIELLTDRRSKQNVIGICHTKLDKDEETGNIQGNPSVPGQVPAYVLSKFPETIYLKIDNAGKRVAHVKRCVWFPAATRRLKEDPIVDPNLNRIYFGGR